MQIFRGPPLIIAIIKMQISNFNWMNDYLKLLVKSTQTYQLQRVLVKRTTIRIETPGEHVLETLVKHFLVVTRTVHPPLNSHL